jgi:hypothetical protein
MSIRHFALIYGIVFLLVGIAGFIPGLVTPMTPEDPDLAVTAGAGHLFGLFPVNVLHNIVHLAFGVWGLMAWRGVAASISYARGVAVIYAVLFVMGFVPGLWTTFGLIPLHGNDIWLHLVLAAVAAYFGYFARSDTAEPRHGATATRL